MVKKIRCSKRSLRHDRKQAILICRSGRGDTTTKLERNFTINAPVNEVFTYISNPANELEYIPSVIDIRDINYGRICVVAMSKKGDDIAVSLYEWAHRLLPRYVDCRPIFLVEILEDSGFQILESMMVKMWRLPVEIALARL